MQTDLEYQRKLCEKISCYVEGFGDKSRRNLATFAKSIGINKQSVYNYMELKRKPRPDIIAKILYKLKLPHLIEEFVGAIHPESYQYKKNDENFFNKEMATLDDNANDFFNNPEYFDILYRCYNKTGESYSKLLEEQGLSAKSRIEKLLEENLIIKDGDLLKCPEGKEDFRPEPKSVQNHIKLSVDRFKYDRSMTKSNMMFHLTEKLDRKTREKLHEYMDNAISIAWSIMNKEIISSQQKEQLINAIDSDKMPLLSEGERTTFLSIVMDDYEKDVPNNTSKEFLH